MNAMNNGSNILAGVGGCILTVCLVGLRLVHSMGLPNQQLPAVAPTATVISAPTTPSSTPNRLVATPTSGVASTYDLATPRTVQVASQTTTDTPAATAMPASDQTVVTGNQATFINSTSGYRLSYPTSWTTTRTGQDFAVLAPDDNAGVEVYVEPSGELDTAGLETELVNKLPVFLQEYGGVAASTPQFQVASVDGISGVVATFAVDKNGQSGIASVSATYSNSQIYFVSGVIADQTISGAAQDEAQVVTIMDGFHLY